MTSTSEHDGTSPRSSNRGRTCVFFSGILCGVLLGAAIGPIARRLALSAGQAGIRNDDFTVATVGGRTIDVGDFCRAVRRRGGAHPELIDRKALLDELIQRQCLVIEAGEKGIPDRPETVRSVENVVIGRLREQELEPILAHIDASRDEVEAYYTLHRGEFTHVAKRRLAIIWVKTHAKMDSAEVAQRRRRIEEIRVLALAQEVPPVKGFGALTIRTSEDQRTRYKGGVIGWVEDGRVRYRYPTSVMRAGFALKEIGDISDIVEAPVGFYLVRLTDRRPGSVDSLASVETRIRHKLILEKRKAIEKRFRSDARDNVDIRTFPAVVDRIAFPDRGRTVPRTEHPPAVP